MKNGKKDYTVSMENAEASVRMEAYTVTLEVREQCERVRRGEATIEKCLKCVQKSRQTDD